MDTNIISILFLSFSLFVNNLSFFLTSKIFIRNLPVLRRSVVGIIPFLYCANWG